MVGSVCALLSGLSGMSALLWLAVAPVLVKLRGLPPLSAAYSLTIPPPKLPNTYNLNGKEEGIR